VSASSRLQALAIKFGVTSCVYLGFCLELGMVEETYAVRVMENIVDSPGHFLVRPVMPPVFWTRHVAWAITTSIDIHQLVSVASSSPRGPVGARSVPIGLQVYVLSLNVMSRPARSPRAPTHPPAAPTRSKRRLHALGLVATLVSFGDLTKWTYFIFAMVPSTAPPRRAPPRRPRTDPAPAAVPSDPAQGAPDAARADPGRGGRARGLEPFPPLEPFTLAAAGRRCTR